MTNNTPNFYDLTPEQQTAVDSAVANRYYADPASTQEERDARRAELLRTVGLIRIVDTYRAPGSTVKGGAIALGPVNESPEPSFQTRLQA